MGSANIAVTRLVDLVEGKQLKQAVQKLQLKQYHYITPMITDVHTQTSHNNSSRWEGWNGIVRLANIYSNHQHSSRDICNKFAQYQNLCFVALVGRWGPNRE